MTRDVCIRNLLKFSETLRRKLCFKDKLHALTRVYIVASRAVQINTDFNVNFSRIYILEKKYIYIYIYIYSYAKVLAKFHRGAASSNNSCLALSATIQTETSLLC